LNQFIIGWPVSVVLNLVDFGKVSLESKLTKGDKWNKRRPVVIDFT